MGLFRCLVVCSIALAVSAETRTTSLKARIDAVIANSPAIASAFTGIRVVRLRDGHVLFEREQDHLFTPASNTKLFTTALALTALGPEYRFSTTVLAASPIYDMGHIAGDVVFAGSGDPSISARHYPYEKGLGGRPPEPFDTIAAIEDLADQIAARGVKSIDGGIVGDDRRYVYDPYPDGWSAGDATWEYGAPVSALIVNDNAFTLWVSPGQRTGDMARVLLSPLLSALSIENRVITTANGERHVHIDRSIGSAQVELWGRIPVSDSGTAELLAVDDPAIFAASMLRDALLRRGIAVRGDAVAHHRFVSEVANRKKGDALPTVSGIEIARRTSPPLAELLQVVDKVSQNLHAEVMLREVGAVRRSMGTKEAGQEEMKSFLAAAGIAESDYNLVDGSGLSRLTLVTPIAITKLLTHMYRSRYREQWISLLPIAGVDGTLAKRFEGHPEAQAIQAKTGSLSHVRAMSGYAHSAEHGAVAFSIMVNNTLATSHDIATFLDTIGLKLIE